MKAKEREVVWAERVAAWEVSGESMRGFAMQRGWTPRQLAYWKARLARASSSAPALIPVRIKRAPTAGTQVKGMIKLSAQGWLLELPESTPASWLVELLRAL